MWCLCLTPPERLHTTCEGCTKYIFESLIDTITKCTKGNTLISEMELLTTPLHYTFNGVEILKEIIHKVQEEMV
jgi:hypothetical protein